LIQAPVFAMGSCFILRNSVLIAAQYASHAIRVFGCLRDSIDRLLNAAAYLGRVPGLEVAIGTA
jgi:hypothetical protein